MIIASDLYDIVLNISVYGLRESQQLHWLDFSFFCIYSGSLDVYAMQSLRVSRLHFIVKTYWGLFFG